MAGTEVARLARRALLQGATSLAAIGVARPALADAGAVEAALAKLLRGGVPTTGKLRLDLPDLADDGSLVSMAVEVASPMTETDFVRAVHVFADANPWPDVLTFHFTPDCGRVAVTTRIRLAASQTVTAVAELSDGTFDIARRYVRVTVGSCTG